MEDYRVFTEQLSTILKSDLEGQKYILAVTMLSFLIIDAQQLFFPSY